MLFRSDYSPKTARFTTVDPIRDGHNWYAYCSNDPVNFVDLWGSLDCGIYNDRNGNPNALKNDKTVLNPNSHADISLSYTKNATNTLTVTVRNKNSDGTYDYSNNGVQVKRFNALNNVLTPEERGEPIKYNGYHYYPEQFPDGTWNLNKSHTSENPLIGPISISTDAYKMVEAYILDEKGNKEYITVRDDGYSIHSGTGNSTWGCIKMTDADIAEIAGLVNSVLSNGGKATITVLDAIKNK